MASEILKIENNKLCMVHRSLMSNIQKLSPMKSITLQKNTTAITRTIKTHIHTHQRSNSGLANLLLTGGHYNF